MVVKAKKTIMAIEERKRWESREKEILEKLEEIKEKKKKLSKKTKEIKSNINEYERAIRNLRKGDFDNRQILGSMDEHIIR